MSEQSIPTTRVSRLGMVPAFWQSWAEALCRARTELLLWAPVAMGIGIGVYFVLSSEPDIPTVTACAIVMVIAIGGWILAPEPLRFPASLIAICLFGFLLVTLRAHSVAAPVLTFRYYGPVEGRVIDIDRSTKDKIRITLDQVRLSRVDPAKTPKTVRIALEDDVAPQPGFRVMTTANLQPPSSASEPGAWDFRRMAWFQGLGAVGYARVPVLIVAPPDPDQWSLAGDRLRMMLSAGMQHQIPGQSGAVASALMTGDRSGISPYTNDIMRASGLYHIVSISGLHMSMLAGFVFAALRYGLALCGPLALYWSTKKIAAVFALIAASVYLWIAGPEVATERSYIMVAIMLAAVLIDRRALSLNAIAFAAIAVMIMRPESMTEPGFQMSFAATIGLILSIEPWTHVSKHMPPWTRPTIALAVTSLVATIATGPISAAQFGQTSVYGIVANMVVVPIVGTIVMPAGVIAAVLAPIGLEYPALWVMDMGVKWMILVADYVAGLDGAIVITPAPPSYALPVMGIGACLAILGGSWVRGAGIAAITAMAALWFSSPRPAVLIASDAQVVGVNHPDGRVLSRASGGFSSASWLRADGDYATPEQASQRTGFTGAKGQTTMDWNGRKVIHLTGKSAAAQADNFCQPGNIVVVNAVTSAPVGGCEMWDLSRLRKTGAIAYDQSGAVSMVNDTTQHHRPWSN